MGPPVVFSGITLSMWAARGAVRLELSIRCDGQLPASTRSCGRRCGCARAWEKSHGCGPLWLTPRLHSYRRAAG